MGDIVLVLVGTHNSCKACTMGDLQLDIHGELDAELLALHARIEHQLLPYDYVPLAAGAVEDEADSQRLARLQQEAGVVAAGP